MKSHEEIRCSQGWSEPGEPGSAAAARPSTSRVSDVSIVFVHSDLHGPSCPSWCTALSPRPPLPKRLGRQRRQLARLRPLAKWSRQVAQSAVVVEGLLRKSAELVRGFE